jgi:membrane-associated protease RseP (regulator of RpoE activity)
MVEPTGFSFAAVQEDFPAALAGAEAGITYTQINGVDVLTVEDLTAALNEIDPGEEVTLSNDEVSYTLVATNNPTDTSRGYMGVQGVATDFAVKETSSKFIYNILQGIFQFLFWVFTLSLGLGAFNLLPLGPVDGGQMIRLALVRMFGEKKGVMIWGRLAVGLLVTILILVFGPIIQSFL